MIALISPLLAPQAHAALVTSEFCFEYSLSLTDGATGDLLTGTHTKARGARVQFVRESDSSVVFDGFVSSDDGDAGCVTLDGSTGKPKLDGGTDYTVKVLREAQVSGHDILVRTASGGAYTSIPTTGLRPTTRTYSYAAGDLWTRLGATDSVQVMAVAQWAIQRRDGGLAGETFTFRTAGCGGSGASSCYDQSTEISWIASADRKFQTAHALGLAIAHYSNGHDALSADDTATVDACISGESNTGHKINTKEYSSLGAIQGLARFYSAVAFNNDGTDADCIYQTSYEVDWKADSDTTDTDEDEVFSCSGSPAPTQSPPIGDFAYFDEKCSGSGTVNNRGTVYDWQKFWWDYHTDATFGGHSVDEVFMLLDDANPDTWTAAGNLGGGTASYPYGRLLDAEGGGATGDFNTLASGVHGVHH